MATITRYPSSAGTNLGTYTNQSYAYALGTDYMTHACLKSTSSYAHFKGFAISSNLPAGVTINSVTIYCTYKVSTTSSTFSCQLAGMADTTAIGTMTANTAEPASDSTISYAISPVPTRAQLADATFGVRWIPSRGSSNTAVTDSVNVIYVVVDYTLPVPTIAIQGTPVSKISDETGKTTCSVTFRSTTDCDQWEARAAGTGNGSGTLVGSGSAISADTDTSFDVTYDELTGGDGAYRINVYGHNATGWTAYG